MKSALAPYESTTQQRVSNTVASFAIEGFKLDAQTLAEIDQVVCGAISAEAMEAQILTEYRGAKNRLD